MITILGVAITLVLVGDLSLPIPNLFGGLHFGVPLALLIPVAVAIVVAWGLGAGDPLVEAVASRPIRLLDTAYALAAATLMLVVGACIYALGTTTLVLSAGRNVLGYVGLMLVGRRILGTQAAAVLPAGVVIGTALLGRRSDGQPRWWAWPLADADNAWAWGIAVLLLLIGALITLMRTDVTAD